MINKSASRIGTIEFTNGNRLTLHVGGNSNTGETIVWQQLEGQRASRITGRNLAPFLAELDEILNEGEGTWAEGRNDAALDALIASVRG